MSRDLLRIKGRTKGRKCPGKGNKQHESGCCSSYEKGVSGKGSHVQKTGGKVNGILCPLQIHLFLKSLLSNNFMRGNRSAEQANEMCYWSPQEGIHCNPRSSILNTQGTRCPVSSP